MSDVICLATVRQEKRNNSVFPDGYCTVKGVKVQAPKTGKEYLAICKVFFEGDEYKAVLCGILDEDYYFDMEEPLRRIVDSYYAFPC